MKIRPVTTQITGPITTATTVVDVIFTLFICLSSVVPSDGTVDVVLFGRCVISVITYKKDKLLFR